MTSLEFTYWLEGYLDASVSKSYKLNPEKIIEKIMETRGNKSSDSNLTDFNINYCQGSDSIGVSYEYSTVDSTLSKTIDKNEIDQKSDSEN
jgi:hypothetical protein